MTAAQYENIEPRTGVTPVAPLGWSPDLVSYENHDAYRDLVSQPSLRTRLQANLIFARSMV